MERHPPRVRTISRLAVPCCRLAGTRLLAIDLDDRRREGRRDQLLLPQHSAPCRRRLHGHADRRVQAGQSRHLRARVRARRTGTPRLPAAAASPRSITPEYTKRREETPPVAAHGADGSLQGDPGEVRQGRHRSHGIRHDLPRRTSPTRRSIARSWPRRPSACGSSAPTRRASRWGSAVSRRLPTATYMVLGWHCNHAMVDDPTEVARRWRASEPLSRCPSASRRISTSATSSPATTIRSRSSSNAVRTESRTCTLKLIDGGTTVRTESWGQGETPVADVSRLLQKEKYPDLRRHRDTSYHGTGAGDPGGEELRAAHPPRRWRQLTPADTGALLMDLTRRDFWQGGLRRRFRAAALVQSGRPARRPRRRPTARSSTACKVRSAAVLLSRPRR